MLKNINYSFRVSKGDVKEFKKSLKKHKIKNSSKFIRSFMTSVDVLLASNDPDAVESWRRSWAKN